MTAWCALIRVRLRDGAIRGGVTVLARARWLRQVPEGRAESRRLLDRLAAERPGDRPAVRERGAWSLGEPDGHRSARADLAIAAAEPGGDRAAAILLALLDRDARRLPKGGAGIDRRLALARAILANSRGLFENSANKKNRLTGAARP